MSSGGIYFKYGVALSALGILKELQRLNDQANKKEDGDGEELDLEQVSKFCAGLARVVVPMIRALYKGPAMLASAAPEGDSMKRTWTVVALVTFVVAFAVSPAGAGVDRKHPYSLSRHCVTHYAAGQYDKAFEECSASEEILGSTEQNPHAEWDMILLGALYARKGDMQHAYQHWSALKPVQEFYDPNSMSGISDMGARHLSQVLASHLSDDLARVSKPDMEFAWGLIAGEADGLAAVLRQQHFPNDADKLAQQANVARANFNKEFKGPSNSSMFVSALAGIATGAGNLPSVPSQSPSSQPASMGGNNSAELHNACISRDPRPWSNPHNKKIVARLWLHNTCSQSLYVAYCFNGPNYACWRCTTLSLSPGESTVSQDYIAECTTSNCSDLQQTYNASTTDTAPKPNVDDSCNASAH